MTVFLEETLAPEVRAGLNQIARLRAVIADRDREIIDLKRQLHRASSHAVREWQDKAIAEAVRANIETGRANALAAELVELRKSRG
jgi:hypothetical protein